MSQALKFPAGLYGVTPEWTDKDRLDDAVRQAVAGGMSALQWRNKSTPAAERRDLAEHLLALCRSLQIPLIINDDWQLAMAIRADGVHLGRDDADPTMVSEMLGPNVMLGVSCYDDLQRAQSLLKLQLSYVAFGAMYRSGTKPQATPAPLSVLTQARLLTAQSSPRAAVVAIGGINLNNASEVLAAGADSLAVVGGLFLAKDIEQTARQFNAMMTIDRSAKS
jgi:thiamine-phosphate pyrophosphorylase